VGSAIANKEYGQYVDLIEVQSTQGQRYKTYVPVDYFFKSAC
jgi:outer membrane lipoprotein SlyB